MTLSGRMLLCTKLEACMKKTERDNSDASEKRSFRATFCGGVSKISRRLRGLRSDIGTSKTNSKPTIAPEISWTLMTPSQERTNQTISATLPSTLAESPGATLNSIAFSSHFRTSVEGLRQSNHSWFSTGENSNYALGGMFLGMPQIMPFQMI